MQQNKQQTMYCLEAAQAYDRQTTMPTQTHMPSWHGL